MTFLVIFFLLFSLSLHAHVRTLTCVFRDIYENISVVIQFIRIAAKQNKTEGKQTNKEISNMEFLLVFLTKKKKKEKTKQNKTKIFWFIFKRETKICITVAPIGASAIYIIAYEKCHAQALKRRSEEVPFINPAVVDTTPLHARLPLPVPGRPRVPLQNAPISLLCHTPTERFMALVTLRKCHGDSLRSRLSVTIKKKKKVEER